MSNYNGYPYNNLPGNSTPENSYPPVPAGSSYVYQPNSQAYNGNQPYSTQPGWEQSTYSYQHVPQQPSWPQEPSQPPKKDKKNNKLLATIAIVTASALFGFGGGMAAVSVANGGNPPAVVYRDVENNGQAGATGGSLSVRDIAASAGKSVVSISTKSVVDGGFFGQQTAEGAGSGVVITENGYIITNNHVVEGAQTVFVTLPDGSSYEAKVVGRDAQTDIAVVKIEAEGLVPAQLGNSDDLEVGDFVLAIGNPMGTLSGTVTDGIISARNREITIDSYTMNLLQMSAAVSPGNSGGGLFNEKGQLIGVVNAKSGGDGAEGLGFAIPINEGMQVAEQLMNKGYVTGRPALGISALEVAETQKLPNGQVLEPGVYVQEVVPGSAADKAGIQTGDRLVSMDGEEIGTLSELSGQLRTKEVGQDVQVEVVRGSEKLTLTVSLQEKVPEA